VNLHARLLRRGVLLLPFVLALNACDSDTLTGPSAVQGVVWKLQTLEKTGSPSVTISQPDRYTIEFRDTLAVKADCNTCTGPYSLNGASLTIGNLACTLVACPADSRAQDFLAVLGGAQTHGVKDDVLTITSSMGRLTFTD
jgi:heat shock protein HslJ